MYMYTHIHLHVHVQVLKHVHVHVPEVLSTISSSREPNMNSFPSLLIIAVVWGPQAQLLISWSFTLLNLFNLTGLGCWRPTGAEKERRGRGRRGRERGRGEGGGWRREGEGRREVNHAQVQCKCSLLHFVKNTVWTALIFTARIAFAYYFLYQQLQHKYNVRIAA